MDERVNLFPGPMAVGVTLSHLQQVLHKNFSMAKQNANQMASKHCFSLHDGRIGLTSPPQPSARQNIQNIRGIGSSCDQPKLLLWRLRIILLAAAPTPLISMAFARCPDGDQVE